MNYDEFRSTAYEFFTLAKIMTKPAQIEAGFKALGIAYLHLKCTDQERWAAASILELASKKQDELLFAQIE